MGEWGGLAGALIGFVLGLLQYRVISGAVVSALRRTDRSQNDAERADYARRIRILQVVLMTTTIGLMPVLGFWVGRTLSG